MGDKIDSVTIPRSEYLLLLKYQNELQFLKEIFSQKIGPKKPEKPFPTPQSSPQDDRPKRGKKRLPVLKFADGLSHCVNCFCTVEEMKMFMDKNMADMKRPATFVPYPPLNLSYVFCFKCGTNTKCASAKWNQKEVELMIHKTEQLVANLINCQVDLIDKELPKRKSSTEEEEVAHILQHDLNKKTVHSVPLQKKRCVDGDNSDAKRQRVDNKQVK